MTRATVGWLFSEDRAAVLYYPPERLQWPQDCVPGGAASCPAIADLARQYYVIRSPFTLSLRCTRMVPGQSFMYDVAPVDGEKVIGLCGLRRTMSVTPPSIWANPSQPTLQVNLPYVFVSDESVYIEQTPVFYSEICTRLPLLLYGGRFPIDIWPRQINFSFQWIDVERNILIRRGEPLFYLRFFPNERNKGVRLVECERTRELESFMASVRDVTEMVEGSYSLFARAAELRPPKLVVPRESYRASAKGTD